jgi:polysaccharide export outer membrane protein
LAAVRFSKEAAGRASLLSTLAMAYVLGDVGRPGGYVMQNSGRISLLQVVAMAQGVNRTAARKHTRLIRKAASGVDETILDLKRVLEGSAADPELRPEDIVYIPPSTAKSLLLHTPALVQAASSAAVYQAVP